MVLQCIGISYTSPAENYRFQGAGTPRKNVAMSSRVCMTHSEGPRTAESGLRLPNIYLAILWREILTIQAMSATNITHNVF